MGTVYTLFVGIDDYPDPVPSLSGCVNDVRIAEPLLGGLARSAGHQWSPRSLLDREATRERVIDAFRHHLGQAREGDTALFYYSGHGSQELAPPEHWRVEPDHLNETVVCADSRTPGSWDLADKELGVLIGEVAAGGGQVVLFLDCCHSGSGTRGLDELGEVVRLAPIDRRRRPLESYLADGQEVAGARGAERTVAGWLAPGQGRHVLLAACQASETAKETTADGARRGAMSVALERVLRSSGGRLRYHDLHRAVLATVVNLAREQHPVLEAADEDTDAVLFGGRDLGPAAHTVSYRRDRGWVLDAGTLHGLPAAAVGNPVTVALYPLDPAEEADGQPVAKATLDRVGTVDSTLRIEGLDLLDQVATYRAVITQLPVARLGVRLEGDAGAVGRLRSSLARAADGAPSPLVEEVTGTPDLIVVAGPDRFAITRAGTGDRVTADVTDDSGGADLVVERLEHIARWRSLADRRNPASRIATADVVVELVDPDGQVVNDTGGAKLHVPEGQEAARARLRVANRGRRRLYVVPLALGERFDVSSIHQGGGEWLEAETELWAPGGEAWLEFQPLGRSQVTDLLKVLVATDQFDSYQFAQDELPGYEEQPAEARLRRVTIGGLEADWTTREILVTTFRDPPAVDLPRQGAAVVGDGVAVLPHPALRGRARLRSAETARDADQPPLVPAILREGSRSVTFGGDRDLDGAGAHEVLELTDLTNLESVTPEAPLVLLLDEPLGAGEHVLAVAFDGEFHLPVGTARPGPDGRAEVQVSRLPHAVGTRDLGGALKMLFRKLVLRPIGLDDFPHLTLVRRDGGELRYVGDQAQVREAVAGAGRILLCVHGILGDTRGMAGWALAGDEGEPSPYDAVLAFDYENLNTPIDQTADALRERLAGVGLAADHGKTLDVVAHSMGGLVGRALIERPGGQRIVSRLVTAGTPHDGSPWPGLQDFGVTALSLVLNGLGRFPWPGAVVSQGLGVLVAASERIDVALDQMKPGSPLLQQLAALPDPGIPYVQLAGNQALVREDGPDSSRLDRLLDRLERMGLPLDRWFHHQPHDLAVSVASATATPTGRQPAARSLDVECDHVTYFSSDAGRAALAEALATPAPPTN
jgi:Caspase domain